MRSILIIEDDELTAMLIVAALRCIDVELIHAATAQDGLNLAKTHQPSLILLDMRLPGMNGWELAPILKSDTRLRQIPIIAVSVESQTEEANAAIRAGCSEFLPKPFAINVLRQRVTAYLAEDRGQV